MKFKFFSRKTSKNKDLDINTDAFVQSNMQKAKKVERNVDPATIISDSFKNARKPKKT